MFLFRGESILSVNICQVFFVLGWDKGKVGSENLSEIHSRGTGQGRRPKEGVYGLIDAQR